VLLTVGELQERVSGDMAALIDDLSQSTGRGGEQERRAWQRSLPRLTTALTTAALNDVHVHFARREHHVALEYQLPGCSSWCDVVLLGRHEGQPSVVVIELKDWETSSDRPGAAEGLVERRGVQELHPSDQVRGYVEYSRRFHSAVIERQALVHGFVLFTTGLLKHPYTVTPNDRLAANFPIFTMAEEDTNLAIPAFFRERLTERDQEFASNFALGTFRQDRGFMQQIGRTILHGDLRCFELLDNQRRALNLCFAKAKEAVAAPDVARKVVIVEGPPGSGKSAVAARLWASLVTDDQTPVGNVVLVTTSQSQSSNWTYLIDQATRNRVGRGVARKATSFSPVDIPTLSSLRAVAGDRALYRSSATWRKNLSDLNLRGVRPRAGAEDDSCLISLVDEAHALINPEREHGVGQFGFVTGLGPQAYHIMRCSRLTVFFLDPDQSFRARENTKIEDIECWAAELGATVERISLEGVQFRCAGSAEYVAWIDSLLGGSSASLNRVYASAWYRDKEDVDTSRGDFRNVVALPVRSTVRLSPVLKVAEAIGGYAVTKRTVPRQGMHFRICVDPFEMESELRQCAREGTVRLVSTYSRPWKTAESTYPHRLPPEAMDFCERVVMQDGTSRTWSRVWNFVPGQDYTGFVSGRIGLPIHDDPLCEVGCTYAVRGFDFDYLGLLWLDDLLWRDGNWVSLIDNVHESGVSALVRQARKEGPLAPVGPKGAFLVERLRRAYRILLTRAIRGMFVWIPDDETREHVSASLSLSSTRSTSCDSTAS